MISAFPGGEGHRIKRRPDAGSPYPVHVSDRTFPGRELSGGQQQRVLLARALCATRKLVLLDEPVAGLDPSLTQTMYDYIYKVNRKMGITVIMVSHDLEAALRYATNILQIGHRQLFYGTPEEYRKSPQYRMLVQSRSTRQRFEKMGGYVKVHSHNRD